MEPPQPTTTGPSAEAGDGPEAGSQTARVEPSAAFINAGDFPGCVLDRASSLHFSVSCSTLIMWATLPAYSSLKLSYIRAVGLAGGGLTGGRGATAATTTIHGHASTGTPSPTILEGNSTSAANKTHASHHQQVNAATSEPSPPTPAEEEADKAESAAVGAAHGKREGEIDDGAATNEEGRTIPKSSEGTTAGRTSLEATLRSLTQPVAQSAELWAQSLSATMIRAAGNSVGGTAGFG